MTSASKELERVMQNAENQFDVRFLKEIPPGELRPEASVFPLLTSDSQPIKDPDTLIALSDWFHRCGYLFTYQQIANRNNRIRTVCAITSRVPEKISVGYHATKTVSVEQVLEQGLLPGCRGRCNSERQDTIGNIYVAEDLGSWGDYSTDNKGTAHWWREHFAELSKENGWSILKVDLSRFQDVLYPDPWSTTGYVVRLQTSIPPDSIEIEYDPSA